MSKKSTARTGSEGDAESTFTDVFANIRSESSSCKSKRELEGGPFGDSPCERNQQFFKDYFILMFQDDDTTSEASEGSDVDPELYNLQNDYLEKLNSVRRTLNLLEISDDVDSVSSISSNNRCIITEIADKVKDSNEITKDMEETGFQHTHEDFFKTSDRKGGNDDSCPSKNSYDLITIYPSTKAYNFSSASTASIFDADYNPPKKKACHRQKTPKLTSVSEGNLPYYTRVGLHDDLFRASKNLGNNNELIWDNGNIETKETQYSEEDFNNFKTKSTAVFIFKPPNNVNLFPEVIINRKTQNISEPSSTSSLDSMVSKPISNLSNDGVKQLKEDETAISLNLVDQNSDDSFTTTTYCTTVDSPKRKKTKKRLGRKHRVSSSEKLTLWEEIRKLHSSKDSNTEMENDKVEKTKIEVQDAPDVDFKCKRVTSDYIRQYIQYKKQMDRVRPRHVPFGISMADRHSEFQRSVEYFCRSESSSTSNRNSEKKKYVDTKENTKADGGATFWQKACFCCWSNQNG